MLNSSSDLAHKKFCGLALEIQFAGRRPLFYRTMLCTGKELREAIDAILDNRDVVSFLEYATLEEALTHCEIYISIQIDNDASTATVYRSEAGAEPNATQDNYAPTSIRSLGEFMRYLDKIANLANA